MAIVKEINQEIDYTRHYKKWHSHTPEHIQQMKNFYRDMLYEFLPLDKEIRILDIGCGMGFTMMFLQDMEYAVIEGIDIDDGQIQLCLSKNLKVTHVKDSTEFLLTMSGTYDLIIALDVIEHMIFEKQLDFVRAIQFALKPGGKLICTVPNANSVLASRWRYIDWTHHMSFTEHSLDFLLFNAGFGKIEIHETEFFHPPKLPPLFSRAFLKTWLREFWVNEDFRKLLLHWQIFKAVRFWCRLQMIAELGWDQAAVVPISPNMLATGVKPG